jgi:hypothetical protein
MNRQTLIIGGIALLIVAAAVSTILITTRKNRVELTGEVLKVRTHQMDPEHTIALLDLRIKNPSTQRFVVRQVEVFVEEPDGKSTPTDLFAESDIKRVIAYYPMLGDKYTPGLLRRDRIASGETTDRSIAVSVPMTDARLGARKGFRVVVHDVDGPVTEIREKR